MTSVAAPKTLPQDKTLQASLATGRATQQAKLIVDQSDVTASLGETEVKATDSLFLKNCSRVAYTVDAMCTKVFVQNCRDVTIDLNARVITQVVEVWNCSNVRLNVNTTAKTVQIDLCENVNVTFASKDHFDRMVWAGTESLELSFKDAPEHALKTGFSTMKQTYTTLNDKTDQFIIRLVQNKATGTVSLLNELIVRLENGFPTTEREARQFEQRQEANLQALARELLGKDIVIGKKKDTGPKCGRNDPCVCGSTKKYKKCCGTDAV